jgi:hypothetical protein
MSSSVVLRVSSAPLRRISTERFGVVRRELHLSRRRARLALPALAAALKG